MFLILSSVMTLFFKFLYFQDGTIPCSDILMSVSSLVALNLVVRVSVDLLEQPKYKCVAPLSTISILAKESGVDFETFYYNY